MRRLLSKLDVQTLVLDVTGFEGVLPQLDGVKLTRLDGQTLEAEMPSTHDLNALFAALTTHGITVTSMRNKTNRLEELFVRLVERNSKGAVA
jgi:ABC-2 type transport system ATP-binding protein